jgi:hypothetical protein
VKVASFHTVIDQTPYGQRNVFHDESTCNYGLKIKQDGNDIAGEDNRPKCDECTSISG